MNDIANAAPQLSRRGLLKVGLLGGAFLATAGVTASLSGCSASVPATGYNVLRASDLPSLRAIIPVVLEGAVRPEALQAAVDATLLGVDNNLQHLSPELLKLTQQLFDVLAMAVTRGPLTGIWGSWENASQADIQQFLKRWEHSSLDLLRMGHASLLQLILMAWYARPQSWAHCGYPGPPQF
ncbi:twin-arginine translocation pathway signal protein [Aquipseudomonas alcaligenes]|uniref:Twin-arginine translocation pathway signal protein n=1 Tax=Aquipseudomonas alcaligenes TaxID=43263 RepID=A0AA42SRP7_AQUAC|nr:twin-arginine translocation pathway signal protein [Pseudomonas alcaligenes]MDH1054074.1 twin-arginine translocation pathway signal protein [Pseudomonas alcaligenes]